MGGAAAQVRALVPVYAWRGCLTALTGAPLPT